MDDNTNYLRRAVLEWELLRVPYNTMILLLGLLSLYRARLGPSINILYSMVIFAAIVNAFYSLGPLVDSYLGLAGYRVGRGRYFLFAAGTLFSVWIMSLLGF